MLRTNIDGASLFVKKIVSLNPTEYKFVGLQWALDAYSRYLFTIHDHYISRLEGGKVNDRQKGIYKIGSAKSFHDWLRTEI